MDVPSRPRPEPACRLRAILPPGTYGLRVPADGSPCIATPDVGEASSSRSGSFPGPMPGATWPRRSPLGLGVEPTRIAAAAATPLASNRLEPIRDRRGVRWFNDSAATARGREGGRRGVRRSRRAITGGTDKKLEFETARSAYARAASVVLLSGTGTDKILPLPRPMVCRTAAPIPISGWASPRRIAWRFRFCRVHRPDAPRSACSRTNRPRQALVPPAELPD